MKLVVLSSCYQRPDLLATLAESCQLFRHDLILVEKPGAAWTNCREGKLIAARDKLKELATAGVYTHALWTDGFDSFMCQPLHAIAREHAAMGSPEIILSAEKNCFPDATLAKLYPLQDSPWEFVCAGGWLVEISARVCGVFDQLCAEESPEDQLTWARAYVNGFVGGMATLDVGCRIFQTMWGTSEFDEVTVTPKINGDVVNHVTGSHPCVIHFNGSGPDHPTQRYLSMWQRLWFAKQLPGSLQA